MRHLHLNVGRLCVTFHPFKWDEYGSLREAGCHSVWWGCIICEWSYCTKG